MKKREVERRKRKAYRIYNEALQKRQTKKMMLSNFLNVDKESRRVMVAAVQRDNVERDDFVKNTIERIYELHGVGGPLHIILDDENVEDHHIMWCLTDVVDDYKCDNLTEDENQELRDISRLCARYLLEMSYSKRKKIIRQATSIMR